MNAASGRVFSWRRMISWRGVFSLRRFFRCDGSFRGGGSFRCGRALSVAAFGRVLRTLGGRNIGKCRLRAHQHPLLPPLSNRCRTAVEPLSNRCGARPHAEHPRQDASSTRDERVLGDVLRMRAEDRLIRASILDFRAKLENRCKVFPVYTLFRSSILDFRPRLANRCKFFPVYTLFRASILDFKPRLANRCSTIVATTMNSPPAA